MIDSPYYGKCKKHCDKSYDSKYYIRKVHISGVRDFLSDFNGKCDHNNQRKNINPCNNHHMIPFCQPFKNGIHDKNKCHSQNSDYKKVQLLV